MAIYRGAGGSGDAVADSSSEALLVRNLAIEVQANADIATSSASVASTSASAASTSATAAAASAASVNDTNLVHISGTETITGTKTFSSTITGSISGNAATATTATNQSGGAVSATTLAASSTVSGTGFSTYLASPPAIGGTTPSTGKFTSVTNTGLTSGRIAYATTGGLLTDSANMAFDGTTITSSFNGAHNGTVGVTTPSTVKTTGLTVTGATSGTLNINATAVAGTNTATFPAATGTVMVSGNMPAFSAYVSSSTNVANGTATKVIYASKDFDTNTNYSTANSRFTPTVAGYYYITGYCYVAAPITVSNPTMMVYKNGSVFASQTHSNPSSAYDNSGITALVYCNGSTDYIEIYVQQDSGVTVASAVTSVCKFSGFMVRAA